MKRKFNRKQQDSPRVEEPPKKKDPKEMEKQATTFGNMEDESEDSHSLTWHLKNMEDKSIESMSNELREGYMQLKDLSSRCMIDMDNITKHDERVFYFRPKSIFLEDPENQRQYRTKFFKDVSKLKEDDAGVRLADQFDMETREKMLEQQLSDPASLRPYLADFFQRRLYGLQHKKYKMLTRWAHFALTASSIDKIGQSGTFNYGRIEYEIENCLKRHERLAQKDGFEEIRDGAFSRPQT